MVACGIRMHVCMYVVAHLFLKASLATRWQALFGLCVVLVNGYQIFVVKLPHVACND